MKNHSAIVNASLGAMLVCLLSSCAHPVSDPEFDRNASAIRNTEHPPEKIAGMWVTATQSMWVEKRSSSDVKIYFLLQPDGTGLQRYFSKDLGTGETMTLEADVTWTYAGKNRWKLTLPSTDKYRKVEPSPIQIGYKPARTGTIRYHDGRLYVMEERQILVPLQNEAEATLMIHRMRQRYQPYQRMMQNLQSQ